MNQKEQPKIDPSTIKKILLIRLRRIGDIMMTTPAIAALRKSLPQAAISYLVEEPYRELVEGNPGLDKTLALPEHQSSGDLFKFIRQLREENYDVVLDFHGGPRAFLLTWLSRASLKIGYKVKYKNFIYHIKLPRSLKNIPIHSVENHVNLVKALGVTVHSIPPLFLPPAQKAEAEKVHKFFTEQKLEGLKVVALHISAGNMFRHWGVDNLVELIRLLSQHKEVKIILVGADEDRKAEKEIQKRCPSSPLSLVGRLNLREVKEFISLSSLFVGPDSGPMHIAAATSTPIVALFGPTLPAHFAPWQAEAVIIEKDLDCRPCRQRRCLHKDFRCLRNIRPENVYKACLRFLE